MLHLGDYEARLSALDAKKTSNKSISAIKRYTYEPKVIQVCTFRRHLSKYAENATGAP
jgi:hypothetical protein